jgi:hypothetical protein
MQKHDKITMDCNRGEMRVGKARLSRSAIKRMDPHERSILFAASRIQNEVRFCVRGLQGAMAFKHDNSIIMKSQLSIELFQVRLLAGMLYEGWLLLERYYFHKDRKNLRRLFQDSADGMGRSIEKVFLSDFDVKHVRQIRNKLAFHFNQDELERQLDRASDELEILVGIPDNREPGKEQIIYYYIEAMLGHALLSKLGLPNELGLYTKTMERVDQSAIAMIRFANKLITWILQKNGQDLWDGTTPFPEIVSDIPFEDSLFISCFVEYSD